MKKMTVSEYSKRYKVSVQSVYQKFKRGSLKFIEENGVKLVIVDTGEVEKELKADVEESCKHLLKMVKSQSKEIKRLTKALEKAKNEEVQTLKAFIGEMKQLNAPTPSKDDFIDIKPGKKKKKKKKR